MANGAALGGTLGAGLGGLLGSIIPGIGTVIGGGLGSLGGAAIGGLVGDDQVGKFWNWMTHGFQDPNAQNDPGLAAQAAAAAQTSSAGQGIQGNNDALSKITDLLQPYLESGQKATSAQNDLSGLNGPDAQAAAIAQIKGGPEYNALLGAGTDSILRGAAATGGIRDGNVQADLARFGPQVLSQLIGNQYSRYAGMSGQGLQGAMGQGGFAANTAGQNAGFYGQQGAAQAGADIATANSYQSTNPFNIMLGLLSSLIGQGGKGANPFAPTPAIAAPNPLTSVGAP